MKQERLIGIVGITAACGTEILMVTLAQCFRSSFSRWLLLPAISYLGLWLPFAHSLKFFIFVGVTGRRCRHWRACDNI